MVMYPIKYCCKIFWLNHCHKDHYSGEVHQGPCFVMLYWVNVLYAEEIFIIVIVIVGFSLILSNCPLTEDEVVCYYSAAAGILMQSLLYVLLYILKSTGVSNNMNALLDPSVVVSHESMTVTFQG